MWEAQEVSHGCLSCVLYSESQQSGDLSDQQGRASTLAQAVRQTAHISDLRAGSFCLLSSQPWTRWRAFHIRTYSHEFQKENSYRDSSDHLTFFGRISFACFSISNCSTCIQNRVISRVPSGGNCQGFQPFPTQLLVRLFLCLPGELNTSVPLPLDLVYPSHLKYKVCFIVWLSVLSKSLIPQRTGASGSNPNCFWFSLIPRINFVDYSQKSFHVNLKTPKSKVLVSVLCTDYWSGKACVF